MDMLMVRCGVHALATGSTSAGVVWLFGRPQWAYGFLPDGRVFVISL